MPKRERADPKAERKSALSQELKTMFDDIADQPIPPNLIDLVDALEEKRRWNEGSPEDEEA